MAGDHLAKAKSLHVPPRFGDLPSNWSWLRLDDASEGVFDCPHSTPDLSDTGPLVVRTQDIITGVFRTEQAAHVSEAIYLERTSRVVPSYGDLLYSREGTYFGIAAEVPDRTRVCLGQRMVLIRPKADVLDFRFLRHWLNSPIMASYIHGYRDGSVAERLNLPTIRALPVIIPPLEEQRAIAHILGTLDDKIELNRRMNETLEAMARALFKSWFVDFDPVRAKAEGRDLGLPKPLADRFPDSFEDSELGEIPKGWAIIRVEDLAEIQGGKQLPTGECLPQGKYPVFGANGIMGYAERATHGSFVIAFGRVGAYCGSIHWAYRGAWINNNASSVVPKRWPEYVLQAMLDIDFHGMRTGSAQPFIPNSALAVAPVICPPDAILEAYCSAAKNLRLKQVALEEESCMLAIQRDALLPKLVSGDLRINNAAGQMGVQV